MCIPFEARLDGTQEEETAVGAGGLYVELSEESNTEKVIGDFFNDANLFLENWRIAFSTLTLQSRLAKERMLREQMYYERLQGIATMVAGVAS